MLTAIDMAGKRWQPAPMDENVPPERIAKVLARRGVASRRAAEELLRAGRITLAGQVITDPATQVAPDAPLCFDGKPVPGAEPVRLWRYHKPPGLVTTARDPQGRPTVFANLPATLPRVVSVGRLDLNSEGLLLLTNSGALARHLELPQQAWLRRYRVRAFGVLTETAQAKLARGLTVEGMRYGPAEVTVEQAERRNIWLSISLREGKNREVRKLLAAVDLQVNRLIRIAFGPFQLGKLAVGMVDEVPARVLRDQLADFMAPGALPAKTKSSP